MAFHNQFCELTQYFREISSQDKFAKLKFQFFLWALIDIVGKLVTARVVNKGKYCYESLVPWVLLDYMGTDGLSVLTDQVKNYS